MGPKWVYIVEAPELEPRFFYTIPGIRCYIEHTIEITDGYSLLITDEKLVRGLNQTPSIKLSAYKPDRQEICFSRDKAGKRIRRQVLTSYPVLDFRVTRVEKGQERTW